MPSPHRHLLNRDYRLDLLPTLLAHVETHKLTKLPEIALYYHSYRMLETDEEAHFRALKNGMFQHPDLLEPEDMRSVYMLTVNFCIQQINRGKSAWLEEVLSIYKEGLANEVLLENGRLSPWTYKNMVSAGHKTGDYAWTAEFIEAYRHRLESSHQDSFYAYSRAQLHFARGEFRKVIRLLNPTRLTDPFTQLDARVLLIKAWYEIGEFDLLEYQLDNFAQHLRRRKLQSYHRRHYKHFIDLTKRLVKGKDTSALRKKIAEADILAEKGWLMGKLE
ncbi:MAG: hypothetical protein AAF570_17380 [Bacteroidota bacterium]